MVYLLNTHKEFYILAEVEIIREGYGGTKEIKLLNVIAANDSGTDSTIKHVSQEFLYTDLHKLIDHLFMFGINK